MTLSEAKLQLLIRLSTKRKPDFTASLYQKLYRDLSRHIVVRVITSATKPADLKEAVLLLFVWEINAHQTSFTAPTFRYGCADICLGMECGKYSRLSSKNL